MKLTIVASFLEHKTGIERENELLLNKLIIDPEIEKIDIISPAGFAQVEEKILKNEKVRLFIKLNFRRILKTIKIVNSNDVCLTTNVRPVAIPIYLFGSKKVRFVQIVHDIIPWLYPKFFPRIASLTYKAFKILVKNRPDLYVVHSDNTKNDLVKHWGISPNKIFKICYGTFVKPMTPRLNFGSRKILFVSTIEPRKGLDRLIDAFKLVRKEIPESQLIIVGKIGWKSDDIIKKIRQAVNFNLGVKYLGYVPDYELSKLYSEVDLFVYPSVYEGFGAPPLEAMASGCPVAVSKTSSIPEVVADAGVYFDPLDVNDMARAIINVLKDDELKIKMSVKGIERAKLFEWDKCLDELIHILKSLVR
jgi:glycosyltransferase involved in cell wall biosynthesis